MKSYRGPYRRALLKHLQKYLMFFNESKLINDLKNESMVKSKEISKLEKELRQYKLDHRGELLQIKRKLKSAEFEVSEYQKLMKEMLEDYDLPENLIEHIQRIQEKIPSGKEDNTKRDFERDDIQNTIRQTKNFGYRANSASIIMMEPREAHEFIQTKLKQKDQYTDSASNIIVTSEVSIDL